ncbi:MAG: GDP-L-fucose synthetase [Flavobacteriaceae bacterium]|nr:GDP-L-fucose synthetase [Flavobacteriaceae bacterium]
MKVLIVGSGGFLGSHVKTILNNEHDIFEITGKKQIDITKYDELDEYLSELRPGIVINCAAFVGGISYGYKYPARMLYENSTMAINLYRASQKNKVEKLINPISNCAYPGNLTTYKEDYFFDGPPDDSVYNYGIAKRLYVQLGKSFYQENNFSSVNVVVSNMYGPNDHFEIERSHALGAIIKKVHDAKINNSKEVELWGTGKPIREWLYVDDGAKALIKSINLESGHHFFNVGVEKGISILELAEIIKDKIGWDGKFVLDTSKPDGVLEKKVDGTRGEEKLNWKPETSLIDGIQTTVNWYIDKYEQ